MNNDERTYLRYYVAHLVRIWTALSMIRAGRSNELVRVLRDVCSDKLRNMLHEFEEKKSWTLGFSPDGTPRFNNLFAQLCQANKWFEGKNGLHSRNCSGAHMQPLNRTEHMFQQFGYGGEREWKHLTKGVAACLGMMALLDGKSNHAYWRRVRAMVRGTENNRFDTEIGSKPTSLPIPIEIEALLQDFVIES